MVKRLKLVKHFCEILVNTVGEGNSQNVSSFVFLKIVLNESSLEVKALVLDHVVSDLPPHDLDFPASLLENRTLKDFADPTWNVSSPIDVLLGQTYSLI